MLLLSLLAGGAIMAGCSAGDGKGPTGGGSGLGGDGDGDRDGGLAGDGDGDGGGGIHSGQYCESFELKFEPKTPTVYVLVDRSGSMGANNENFWGPLKASLLPAIQSLQEDVRFGFGTYTATSESQCQSTPSTVLDDLGTISENNYDAIAAKYNGYADPNTGETPTSFAIDEVTEVLLKDPSPGDRYIVLVTDGNPDFCNDPNKLCAQDVTVASLQAAAAQGIRTIVFGLQATKDAIDTEIMDVFATAGWGEPTSWSAATPAPNAGSDLDYQCSGPQGTYSETSGSSKALLTADPDALVESLGAAVAGLKSCAIDFNFEVKEGADGDIYVDGGVIPQEEWELNASRTGISLKGASCELWKTEGVTDFDAGFKCESIILR